MRINLFGMQFGSLPTVSPDSEKHRTEPTLTKAENDFGIDISPIKHAGVTVNTKTAMALDTVYACIRDKAESIGQLPVKLYNADMTEVVSGREHKIFTQSPNAFMTMQDLLETYVTCLETYGKFFAYTVRNKYGNVSEILPFRYQTNVRVDMDTRGQIYYTYTTNDSKPNITFAGDEIIHIKLNSLDGFTGISPISSNTRSIGIAIGQETYIDSLMANGAMPKAALVTDAVFSDVEKAKRIITQWNDVYGGSTKAGKTVLLENGLKHQALTLSPADTELIKQRQYSKSQICAIFRVPPHRVGATDAQIYKNLEDNNRAYMRDALVPIITKFENAIKPFMRGRVLKLDTKGFVRGDRLSQVEAVGAEVKLGLVSINEGRVDLDRQPKDGGDVHAIDTNNLRFGLLTDIPELQAEYAAQAGVSSSTPNVEPVEEE